MIAPAGPGLLVAGGEQRVRLWVGEVGQQPSFGAFGGDRQDALDAAGVLGVAQREVAEQGVDRGEPVVPGRRAVASLAFQVVQERADQRRVAVRVAAKVSSSRKVVR